MKAKELREMSASDKQQELLALTREQFNLRMQKATGQLTQTHLLRKVRRTIARLRTVMQNDAGQVS